jgi:hypothetical protein
MQKLPFRLASILFLLALTLGFHTASAQKLLTLETTHYRVGFEKKYSQLATEVLKVAESVWPTLAKAYDSYDRYERIDILITDDGDDANGFAIYNFSRVMIFAPHMDWVMRNRQSWIQNVVTHELAHIFSLRRAAYLSPIDGVTIYGSTYNYKDRVNYSFQLPWVPLIAPTWYVEGIAQFEAAQNGNDSWDSQRDMIVRDAYLTGSLPTLDFIETFERDEDWTQAERCYNTGFAFLLYLKDRFGVDKVRELARPKPIFNFSYSVEKAFGKELVVLFDDFKRSLADRYADFKDIPRDSTADKDMEGGFQQNLTFSNSGRYMAWLGNAEDRRAPMNWIFWKEVGKTKVIQSKKTVDQVAPMQTPESPAPAPTPQPKPNAMPGGLTGRDLPTEYGSMNGFIRPRLGNPNLGLARNLLPNIPAHITGPKVSRMPIHSYTDVERSREPGSAGLEFNHDDSRLLTTRQDRYATYTDIWEYAFRTDQGEDEKWHRLTWEERAAYPSYHPEKNLIVYSRKKAGSSNLAILDSTGHTLQLTNFSNGEQVYNPRYTPKGDSIYFTLGMQDKEAIVSINTNAIAFDPFQVLKDSSLFPDSLNLAKSQKLTFITPFRRGSIRDVRFANDTLFWSSNTEDSVYSVYDIYAKLPNDSAVYRATRVSGQALEALPRNGTLYYQGFLHQRFQLFQQPLGLTRTTDILRPTGDSIPTTKPKREDFSKVFESGEYGGSKVAMDITPYLAVQPQFISGDKSYTDLALGLSLTLGEAYGSWIQSVSAAITKRADLDNPLNYQFGYSGSLSSDPIRHNRFTWPVDVYYSLYHDVVQSNEVFIDRGGFRQGTDSIAGKSTTNIYSNFSRDAAYAASPLPYNFLLDASYWRQLLTQDFSQKVVLHNLSTDQDIIQTQPRVNLLKDATQHRHFNTGLTWSWSKGALGTYRPSGGGLYASLHKWWATYQTGDFADLDSASMLRITQGGETAPAGVLTLAQFEPWSVDGGVSGVWSPSRTLSFFANAEASAFLNKTPTRRSIGNINGTDTTMVDELESGLWAMTYRIGYYRLNGYPYNFVYRGRDLMEGSSFAYGQGGFQIPIKTGVFLPGLPLTSFKQFMITGIGEWASTLVVSPGEIYKNIELGKHYLLLDYGLRFSANFHLYHQIPFTIFAQAFQPFNTLSAENLFVGDYAKPTLNDAENRRRYINQVKDPRFFVGFNLGTF